jgi:tetratricopeptide (TPR) repeat protein
MSRFYRMTGIIFLSMLSVGCMRTAALFSVPASPPQATPELRKGPPPDSKLDAALVQFNKGIQFLESGRTKEARSQFEKLRDAYPKMSIFHANLGVAYKRLGLLPEAISSYQRALEIDRRTADVYYNMAIALREQGEFRKAEEAYRTALAISPDFRDAHYNLAVLYDLYLNQPDEAIRHYQNFLEQGGEGSKEIQIWIVALQKRMDGSGGAQ